MATWKKLAYADEVATLSDSNPSDIGTAASPGVASDASRHDHVHKIGTGAINSSGMFGSGVVDNAAIGTGAVDSDELAASAVIEAKIATGAVTNTKIGADAVDGDKIADDVVGSECPGGVATDRAALLARPR